MGIDTGDLIPRAEVERHYARAFGILAMLLDATPDHLERDGLPSATVARVADMIERERTALADRLRSF